MVHADRREHHKRRMLDNVCRVQPTAQARFKHHHRAACIQRDQHSDRQLHFKDRRMRKARAHDPLASRLRAFKGAHKSLFLRRQTARAETVQIGAHLRRGVGRSGNARRFQDRSERRHRRALAVRASNVDDLQRPLRTTKRVHQTGDIFQAIDRAKGAVALQGLFCFFVSHNLLQNKTHFPA